jgi:DNA-binding MarR family transcriptional regulator
VFFRQIEKLKVGQMLAEYLLLLQAEVVPPFHIISCYDIAMPTKISSADYRALADMRCRIRQFLCEGDAAARQVGLEPQQYLLLLAIRGLPEGAKPTIRTLAERLALKHNSTVELINRLETHGYVHRSRSRDDRRCILVLLLPRGEKLLERVARQRITEVRAGGAELVNSIDALLGHKRRGRERSENVTKKAG